MSLPFTFLFEINLFVILAVAFLLKFILFAVTFVIVNGYFLFNRKEDLPILLLQ